MTHHRVCGSQGQHLAAPRGAPDLPLQRKSRPRAGEDPGSRAASHPGEARLVHPHDRARREPAHAIRRREKEHGALGLRGPGEAHPRGLGSRAA